MFLPICASLSVQGLQWASTTYQGIQMTHQVCQQIESHFQKVSFIFFIPSAASSHLLFLVDGVLLMQCCAPSHTPDTAPLGRILMCFMDLLRRQGELSATTAV